MIPTPPKKLRVLVVDDEPLTSLTLKLQLTALGYQVVATAGSGEQALQMYDIYRPELVLMDVKMPGMDGIEAARLLRTRTPATAVIMVTAYNDNETLERIRQAGAAAYVIKPADEVEIRRVVEGVWRQKLAEAFRSSYSGQVQVYMEKRD